jgi:hypothetical protein
MKRYTAYAALAVLFFSGIASAKKKDPADYPLTAHVVSTNRTGGYDSTAIYTNGQYSGQAYTDTSDATVQFQIGNLVYTGGYACRKKVQVGMDVHARWEGKGEKHIFILTDDGKSCDTRIRGVREAQSQPK